MLLNQHHQQDPNVPSSGSLATTAAAHQQQLLAAAISADQRHLSPLSGNEVQQLTALAAMNGTGTTG